MTINYAPTLKNTRETAVITALDGIGNAKLVLFDAGYTHVIVTITLAKPSFVLSAGVLTLQGTPLSGVAVASFTAVLAQLQDSAGTWWVQGLTVGTSGTDIVLNSNVIVSGQTLTVSSGTITAAP